MHLSSGEEQHFQLNKKYYVASLILHASIGEITAQRMFLSYVHFYFIRRRLDYQDFCKDEHLGYVVSMGCVSVTRSYSFRCLTTETVKYIDFIENLAASKYSMWAQRGKKNL